MVIVVRFMMAVLILLRCKDTRETFLLQMSEDEKMRVFNILNENSVRMFSNMILLRIRFVVMKLISIFVPEQLTNLK